MDPFLPLIFPVVQCKQSREFLISSAGLLRLNASLTSVSSNVYNVTYRKQNLPLCGIIFAVGAGR